MSLIIPYDENIVKNGGAFISPNGKIFYTYGKHDKFAYDFCNGKDYDNLVKKQSEVSGTPTDIYKSTMLTKNQLNLYKLWLKTYKCAQDSTLTDFMVEVLSFDKAITINIYQNIITTYPQPHIRFFNYYLMDWNIYCIPPMIYNKELNCLEYKNNNNSFIAKQADLTAENKIYYIKKHYSLNNRSIFLK